MNRNVLLDILLLPQRLYGSLKDNRLTLYLGILCVGLIDVGFSLGNRYRELFIDTPHNAQTINIALVCIFVVLIGIIDVVFFSIPLFDLFKKFKEEDVAPADRTQLIRLMKVYIVANFLLIPLQGALLYLAGIVLKNPTYALIYLLHTGDLIISIWFSAAIARGINSIYNFQPLFKRLVFPLVLLWTYLLGLAMAMIFKGLDQLLR